MVKRSVAENRPVCIAEELLLFGTGHSQPPRVTYGAKRSRYIGAWIQTFCVRAICSSPALTFKAEFTGAEADAVLEAASGIRVPVAVAHTTPGIA
jgi:hypothetical protein